MNHPKKDDLTYKIIFELLSKYPEIVEPYIKIEIKNIEELCKQFSIVDGKWRLASSNSRIAQEKTLAAIKKFPHKEAAAKNNATHEA